MVKYSKKWWYHKGVNVGGKMKDNQAGFTLLELIIVIVAIGILAALIIMFGK
jgi:prepilin-type N-terminal cleavage/methylation domain-containing protein